MWSVLCVHTVDTCCFTNNCILPVKLIYLQYIVKQLTVSPYISAVRWSNCDWLQIMWQVLDHSRAINHTRWIVLKRLQNSLKLKDRHWVDDVVMRSRDKPLNRSVGISFYFIGIEDGSRFSEISNLQWNIKHPTLDLQIPDETSIGRQSFEIFPKSYVQNNVWHRNSGPSKFWVLNLINGVCKARGWRFHCT